MYKPSTSVCVQGCMPLCMCVYKGLLLQGITEYMCVHAYFQLELFTYNNII